MNKSKLTLIRKQSGMSLLEIIIVLGIIGTIAAGVVVLAQRALDNKSIADLNTNINSTRLAMTATFRTSGYPGGDAAATSLTPPMLEGEGIALANATLPTAQLYLMGAISVQELTNTITGNLFHIRGITSVAENVALASPASGRVFSMTVSGLNSKQCTQVVTTQAGQWDYVEVLATDTVAGIATTALNSEPADLVLRTIGDGGRNALSVLQIATACAAPINTLVLASR